MDKPFRATSKPYISPYLKGRLRSLSEVQDGRRADAAAVKAAVTLKKESGMESDDIKKDLGSEKI